MSLSELIEEKANGFNKEVREDYRQHLELFVWAMVGSDGDFNAAAVYADNQGVNPFANGWVNMVWYDAVEVYKSALN